MKEGDHGNTSLLERGQYRVNEQRNAAIGVAENRVMEHGDVRPALLELGAQPPRPGPNLRVRPLEREVVSHQPMRRAGCPLILESTSEYEGVVANAAD